MRKSLPLQEAMTQCTTHTRFGRMIGKRQNNAASFSERNYERTLGTIVNLIPERNSSSRTLSCHTVLSHFKMTWQTSSTLTHVWHKYSEEADLQFAQCVLLLVCAWLYVPGCVCLVVCAWLYVPGCICLVVCAWFNARVTS